MRFCLLVYVYNKVIFKELVIYQLQKLAQSTSQ